MPSLPALPRFCYFLVLLCTLLGWTESRAEAPPVTVQKNLAYKTGEGLTAYEQERCRLAKYPAGIADTAAAFAWVKQHIAEHGGDPARLFLGGHSAGGYLTLMVGLDARYLKAYGLDPSAIAGLVPVAGQTLTHYSIREERGLPKDRIIADEAAPLHHVRKDAPPMLILYAENDMAMRAQENELLAAALRQAGHAGTTLRMIKGHDHGSVGNDLALPDDEGFAAVMKFILPEKPDRP